MEMKRLINRSFKLDNFLICQCRIDNLFFIYRVQGNKKRMFSSEMKKKEPDLKQSKRSHEKHCQERRKKKCSFVWFEVDCIEMKFAKDSFFSINGFTSIFVSLHRWEYNQNHVCFSRYQAMNDDYPKEQNKFH